MDNLLYVIAFVLLIFWAIGLMEYNVGAVIHIFLIISLISITLRIIQKKATI